VKQVRNQFGVHGPYRESRLEVLMVYREAGQGIDFLSQVVQEAPVPLWVIDRRGLVALANKMAIRFLGYRVKDDVVGGPSHDLLHRRRPDGSPYPRHECPIVCSNESHSSSEWFITRAGDTRPVRWSTRSVGKDGATLLSFTAPGSEEARIVREMRKRGPAPRVPTARARAELRESMYRSIEGRFMDPTFSTADLAAAAHLSVRSVQAIFAEAGSSPAAEIRRRRLDHSRAMLEQGHAVQTACHASGFIDPGSFARTFQQRFGLTPSQIQRTLSL
jgi:PAS domain S-box-containing protein